MKLMVVLGDSLSMVRPTENIGEKDIYSFKIHQKLKNNLYVINKSERRNTTKTEDSSAAECDHIKAANCNYAIIQLGICDCLPRIFTPFTRSTISYLKEIPLIRRFVNQYVLYISRKRYQITSKRYVAEVILEDFTKHLDSIVAKLTKFNSIDRIFIINIVHPGAAITQKSFGVLENIIKYNKVIANKSQNDLITIVDLFNFTKDNPQSIIQSDGYHINTIAHDFIANSICSEIKLG